MRLLVPCVAFALGFMLAVQPVSSATPPLSATALLAKMADAYGGRSVLDGIKSQTVVVSLTIQGQPATATTTSQAPNKYLSTVEIPAFKVKVVKGFDGTTAWSTDAYGMVHALTGTDAAELQCEAIYANDPVVYPDRWPTTLKIEHNQTIDGKPYIVLTVTPKGCDKSTEFIDPQSFLVNKFETEQQSETFSNFKKGPAGELYPSTIVVTNAMGVIVVTVQSLQDNPAVSSSAFAQPSPAPSGSPALTTAAPASPVPNPSPSGTLKRER